MTSLVRHHTRWCLFFTGALLVVAFGLHGVQAQRGFPGQPGGFTGRPAGFGGQAGVTGMPAGFVGQPGGFPGQPGGFVGQPAGFVGQPGGIVGQPGGIIGQAGGFTGRMPGIGGGRDVYTCSNCGREVSRFALTCPSCRARFNGTVVDVSGKPPQGGLPTGFNPGQPPPTGFTPGPTPPVGFQPPIDTNPLRPDQVTLNDFGKNPGIVETPVPPSSPTANGSSSSGGSSSKSSAEKEKTGLSGKTIIGVGVAALGVFALIAGVVVVLNQGPSSEKPKRRPRRFRD